MIIHCRSDRPPALRISVHYRMQDHLTTLQCDYIFEPCNVCPMPSTISDSFADYSEIALITPPSYYVFLRQSDTSHKHAFDFCDWSVSERGSSVVGLPFLRGHTLYWLNSSYTSVRTHRSYIRLWFERYIINM
jgi:hypothetical protein